MPPTPTVENYLKAILQAQVSLPGGELVPMGQVASTLGVTPGTTTTMVKALSEAGLLRYEPYGGVRLSTSGEKLAARVVRRHRLIELFLVRVMGMNWTEVHDEAEHLEHAVSDSLIERMDDMLGHPAADPHGDPIPGREGAIHVLEYQNLLSCPVHTPVVVKRIADQTPEFLRFVEHHELKPGQRIEVEERDTVADAVTLSNHGRRVTVGMSAASKLLVDVVMAWTLLIASVVPARAQAVVGNATPFDILDNSFMVEEAFNQEPGIFQNIFGVQFGKGIEWDFGFTQEWPIGSQTHQFSYIVPVSRLNGSTGVGDLLINYRYQLWLEGAGRPAFSPRVSLILPSGDEHDGRGAGVVGWQINLPFSKQGGDVYYHWNAGFTWLPGVSVDADASATNEVSLFSPHVAGSVIWRTAPMFNLMLEALAEFEEGIGTSGATERSTAFTVSPGFRTGWNVSDHQLIVGFAAPITFAEDATDTAAFVYFSYELPFKR